MKVELLMKGSKTENVDGRGFLPVVVLTVKNRRYLQRQKPSKLKASHMHDGISKKQRGGAVL
jgi:hypothetical protein